MAVSNSKHLVKKTFQQWQSIVDSLAYAVQVPVGLITRLQDGQVEILFSSENDENPYESGGWAPSESFRGGCCEHVIRTQQMLQIENALEDSHWKSVLNGSMEMISYLGIPLNYPDGSAFGAICILDTKERHFDKNIYKLMKNLKGLIESQLALQEQNKLLKQAVDKERRTNELKNRFLANVNHEVCTPMNAIIGFSDIIKRKVTDSCLRSYCDNISQAGRSLLTLINEILDLSQAEANLLKAKPQVCNLRAELTRLPKDFAVKLREKDLRFKLEFAKNFPEMIHVDNLRIYQILSHLMDNAIKFSSGGYVTLRAEAKLLINDEADLKLSVSDNGIGISAEEQENIFMPFEQNDDSYKQGGNGLGLSLCYHFAHMLGGEISVESKVNQGSTFTLNLSNVHLGLLHENPVSSSSWGYEFAPARILIVDDVEFNCQLLTKILSKFGFEIQIAHDGQSAVEKADDWQPDLILMDIIMPKMDGIVASEKIRKFSQVPMIFISADKNPQLEEGAVSYIQKPISRQVLLDSISQVLSHTRTAIHHSSTQLSKTQDKNYKLPANVLLLHFV